MVYLLVVLAIALCIIVVLGGVRWYQTFQALHEAEKRLRSLGEELSTTYARLMQNAKLSTLGMMAAGMAHELNNPLTGVKGFAQLLVPGETDSARRNQLNHIIILADRMQKIIEHVRTFAREGKKDDWQLVTIDSLISSAIDLLGPQLRTHGISVRTTCAESTPIMGNAALLESVFHNLLINSKDAFTAQPSEREKTISISCSFLQEPATLEIRYRDTAGGIPPAILPRIFDPFFTSKPRGKGTGLGLSITRTIIAEHQGSIEVINREGEGAEFVIRFPVAASLQASHANPEVGLTARSLQNAAPVYETKPRVLIIDDEPVIGEVLRQFIADEFSVTVTSNPQEGLTLAQQARFDAVITDLKMPEVSGMQIIEAVKQHSASTPVLVISGLTRNDTELTEALAQGADGVITKPFGDDKAIKQSLYRVVPQARPRTP